MITDAVVTNDWYVIGRSEELAEQGVLSTRLLDIDLVLWRTDDQIMVWTDSCAHRGTRLSLGEIKDSCLVCPYHGWEYNTSGRCVRIPAHPTRKPPATAKVQTYKARERYGLIWVTIGEPESDVPPFVEWDDPRFRKVLCGPYSFQASGPRVLENFVDIAHMPFLHDGELGISDQPEIPDYTINTGSEGIRSEGITASKVGCFSPDMFGTGSEVVFWTFQIHRPLAAYLVSENEGPKYALTFWVTPQQEFVSNAWAYLAFDSLDDTVSDEDLRAWQDKITLQDIPIVESQSPARLPLNPRSEIHTGSDRLALGYRRWLKDLGMSFGTC